MARNQHPAHRSRGVPGLQAAGDALRGCFKPAGAQVREPRRPARHRAGLAAPPVAVPEKSDGRCCPAFRAIDVATFLAHRFRPECRVRMTRYAVRHATTYEYGGDVSHSHHLLHLKPREFELQRCLKSSLALDPQPSSVREDVDAFGNSIARLEYDRSHDRLAVVAEMHVEIFPRVARSLESAQPW